MIWQIRKCRQHAPSHFFFPSGFSKIASCVGTGQQEELLQMVVALAFYPNLALPHENNRDRCSAECVFHTRHVPFVNLHPSSVTGR